MFENRKSYRLPLRTKFIFSLPHGVFTGNTDNISSGGVFVRTFETTVSANTKCTALFVVNDTEAGIARMWQVVDGYERDKRAGIAGPGTADDYWHDFQVGPLGIAHPWPPEEAPAG